MYKLGFNKTWRVFKKVCSLILVLTFSVHVLPVKCFASESTNYTLSTFVMDSASGERKGKTFDLKYDTFGEAVNGESENSHHKTQTGFLHTIIKDKTNPPLPPQGTEYLAKSANFRNSSFLFSMASCKSSSKSFNIPFGCLGEPIGGIVEGYSKKSFSGHLYSILGNPPILKEDIPTQSWQLNTAKTDALCLDDYFIDPDGDNLTFAVSGNENIAVTIDPVTHQVSFTPNTGFVGKEEIIIEAFDSAGNRSLSYPIILNVYNTGAAVNNPPVLDYIADIIAKEGNLIKLTPHTTDPDADSITYSFSLPFNSQGTWQTDYKSSGTYNITVTASDGSLKDTRKIKVTVLDVNRKPTLDYIPDISGPENQLITILPSGSDPDGDDLIFSFSSPFNQQGQWLPSYRDCGVRKVTVTVSDGSLSDSQVVLVNVVNVNTTPTLSISLDRINAAVGEEIAFIVTASDIDNDPLTLILQKDGQQFYSGGIYDFYVGATSFSSLGTHTIKATVSDNHGASVQTTTNIEIINSQELWNKILPLLGDFNGDGIVDIGTYNRESGCWAVALSNFAGFGSITEWLSSFGASTDWQYVNGDFNGDGRTDIAIFNQSNGQWQVGTSGSLSFTDQGVWATFSGVSSDCIPITGDFNGDGVSDVGIYNKSNGNLTWALSDKSKFNSANTWGSFAHSDKAQAFSGDFNGDGLIDIGVFNDGSWSFAVSSGTGFIAESGWNISFGAGRTPVISDFNNDGLTDIGVFTKETGLWQIYYSTGNGFVSGGDWLDNFGQGEQNSVYALDFNGDGLTDASVFDNSTFTWQRLAAKGNVGDLLKKITNSLGGTTEITYKSSVYYDNTGDDDQCDLPFAMQTVSSVKQGDALGNFYKTSYFYANGLYDSEDRETRGFGYVKVTDGEKNISETWFNQDDIYKGLPYKTQISDSYGYLYLETEKIYDYTTPYDNCTFARLIEEETSIFDGQITPRTTKTTYEYDDYGNPTKIKSFGDVDIAGDEKESNIEYVYDQGLWILGLPCYSYLKDAQEQIVSQRWLYYDNNTNWQGQTLSRALLTQEGNWLDSGDNPTTSYSYDDYGNLHTITDALGITTTTSYEETYHTFPKSVTNSLGHTLQYTYDSKTGQILTSTDPNGQITTNEYDVFGRLIKAFGPNDSTLPGIEYDYDLESQPLKITTRTREEHDTADSNKIRTAFAFYDGLGRLIQTKTEAEDPTKQIVSGVVTFDSRGNPEYKYLPYFTNETFEYTNPDFNQPKITYQYDCLGRIVGQANADSTYKTVEYFPAMVTATDENGHKIRKHQDAYGQTIKIEEFNHGHIYTTRYGYDTQGNLLQTIDDKNNVTSITYDSLGRKTSMDDPDMGTWSYEYDANGNLIKQTDAKGQILEFEFDALNRLTLKSLRAAEGGEAISAAAYYYDDTTKPNCIGRLSKIEDQSGQTEFFYDNLGREIKTIKSLRAAEGGEAISYTVERTYDALDRLTSVTYPNGKVASYTYNRQGGIESVHTPDGEITNIDYTENSQIELIQYSNGTETQYSYNANTLRLNHLLTTSSSATLQNLTYSFDNVGNVSSIIDNSSHGTNTQSFQYDDLNRLTSASGSYGTIGYQYDSIGNMLQKGNLTLEYGAGGVGPHAVTQFTDTETSQVTSINYDTNGNMLSKGTTEYQYDIENRLTSVTSLRGATEGSDEAISIELSAGWNFLGIPLGLSDYSIAAVLSSIEGKYDQVTRYNPTTKKFESFINNSKFDEFNTFSFGEGYLIHIIEPCTLSITGSSANGLTDKQLKSGWNLIAAPTTEAEISTQEALNNLVQGEDYDKVAEYNGSGYTYDPATMQKGKAYYIHALKDTTWQITQGTQKQTTTFNYDGDGGRVKKTTLSQTTTYIGSLYEERQTSEGTTYVYHIFSGANRAFSIETTDSETHTYFYHQDHLGSSNVISDNQGNLAQLLEYTPYGLTNRQEGDYNTNYRFTGKLFDNTDLYYYGARYYDPEIGRFTQPDTIVQNPSDPQSFNRYAYCRNNPVNYIDPTGYGILDWICKGVGAIAGALVGFFSGNPALGVAVYSAISSVGTAIENDVSIPKAIGIGIVSGISAYAVGNIVGSAVGNRLGDFWGGLAAGALGGAAGGAAGAAMWGGNVERAALGGLAGGAGSYLFGPVIGGGLGAEAAGGDFWEGAAGGAAYAIGSYIGYKTIEGNLQAALDAGYKRGGTQGKMAVADKIAWQRKNDPHMTMGGWPDKKGRTIFTLRGKVDNALVNNWSDVKGLKNFPFGVIWRQAEVLTVDSNIKIFTQYGAKLGPFKVPCHPWIPTGEIRRSIRWYYPAIIKP